MWVGPKSAVESDESIGFTDDVNSVRQVSKDISESHLDLWQEKYLRSNPKLNLTDPILDLSDLRKGLAVIKIDGSETGICGSYQGSASTLDRVQDISRRSRRNSHEPREQRKQHHHDG